MSNTHRQYLKGFFMENRGLTSLLLVLMGSFLYAMDTPEEKSFSASDLPSSALNIPALRLGVVQYLLQSCPTKDVAHTLIAWGLTDKSSAQALKNSTSTSLINLIRSSCYSLDYDEQSLLATLKPPLSQKEYDTYTKQRALMDNLVFTFESCKEQHNWNPAFTALEDIKERKLIPFLNSCYWIYPPGTKTPKLSLSNPSKISSNWEYPPKEMYLMSPARKTILTYALEFNAPIEVIQWLIKEGASVTNLHPQTPPPLLMVCRNISEIFYSDLEDKDRKKLIAHMRDLTTLLINSGACVNDAFTSTYEFFTLKRKMTPLLDTILAPGIKDMKFLLSQASKEKIIVHPEAFIFAAGLFMNSDPQFPDDYKATSQKLKMLITLSDDRELLLSTFGNFTHLNDSRKVEPAIAVLSLLIDQGVNINHREHNMTILDKALQEDWHTDIILFLSQKGARPSTPFDLSEERGKNYAFFKAYRKLFSLEKDFYIGYDYSSEYPLFLSETSRNILKEFLPKAQEFLQNNALSDEEYNNIVIHLCLTALYWGLSQSNELHDFFVFIATFRPLSFTYFKYGTITSVYHILVAYLSTFRTSSLCCFSNNTRLNDEMKDPLGIRSLIHKLAYKGIKDDIHSKGKTAVEKAREFRLNSIADFITTSLNCAECSAPLLV